MKHNFYLQFSVAHLRQELVITRAMREVVAQVRPDDALVLTHREEAIVRAIAILELADTLKSELADLQKKVDQIDGNQK